MKKIIFAIGIIAFMAISCVNKAKNHPYAGKFITETGTIFELREDSTTCIQFADSLQYEGKWSSRRSGDTLEYANIEFAGYPTYYYLKDGKLYRSKREMISGKLGEKINYMN